MYLSRLSRGWPCRQLLVTQSRFLTTAMVRRPLKVPTPEQQTIAARQVWEPFGQYAAPIVGAEGEHSQRPFLIRLSVTFVCKFAAKLPIQDFLLLISPFPYLYLCGDII